MVCRVSVGTCSSLRSFVFVARIFNCALLQQQQQEQQQQAPGYFEVSPVGEVPFFQKLVPIIPMILRIFVS